MFPKVPCALLSKNPLRHLKFYGPGAIVASVTNGGGETPSLRRDAISHFVLLWCFTWVACSKGFESIPAYVS